MATIIEIKTGNRLENVADGKAATLVQSGRYYYEGEKVEVSPDLATELLEAEKQALIEEREELEAQKSDVTIKRENLQIDIAAFETEKQKHVSTSRKLPDGWIAMSAIACSWCLLIRWMMKTGGFCSPILSPGILSR